VNSKLTGLGPAGLAGPGHGRRVSRRRAAIVVTAVAVSLAAASAPGGPPTAAVTRSTSPPPEPKPVETLPAPNGGGVFTFGEVAIPQGQPGQLFVVLARPADSAGHMPIVVRNNRDVTVYDVSVRLVGSDASGSELGVAECTTMTY
jgi:hypothetical protein